MGYDKTQVFDIEEHAEVRPEDEILDYITRQMDSDRWYAQAMWYAQGRLYYEIAVLKDEEGEDDDQGTAMGFALAYQRMMIAFRDRTRTTTVPMQAAWSNFVDSAGGTIENA